MAWPFAVKDARDSGSSQGDTNHITSVECVVAASSRVLGQLDRDRKIEISHRTNMTR